MDIPHILLKIVKDMEYDKTHDFIKDRAKQRGLSLKKYYCTDEYKAFYSILRKKHKDAKNEHNERLSQRAFDCMFNAGVDVGDKVEWSFGDMLGDIHILEGVIKLDKNNIPYVILDTPIWLIEGIKKKVRWHIGFKKVTVSPIPKVYKED